MCLRSKLGLPRAEPLPVATPANCKCLLACPAPDLLRRPKVQQTRKRCFLGVRGSEAGGAIAEAAAQVPADMSRVRPHPWREPHGAAHADLCNA